MEFRYACRTDVGRVRSRNEDAVRCVEDLGVFIVADGMGGHQGGEEASRLVCETLESYWRPQRALLEEVARDARPEVRRRVLQGLVDALIVANDRLVQVAEAEVALQGMGSTAVVLLLAGDRAFIGHVGDSRAYLIRDRMATLLTEDHSLFFELLHQGRLTRSQVSRFPMRNVVTRALGVRGPVQPDVLELSCLPGDRFLLCSDGLHGYLEDERVPRLCEGPVETVAERAISFANACGGTDNISAVVVEVRSIEGDPLGCRERLRRLRETTIFRALGFGEVLRVISQAEHRLLGTGEVLARVGDRLDSVIVLLSGELEIRYGDEVRARLGPGGTFGEVCLLEDRPLEVSVLASAPSEVALISRRWFEMESVQRPAMALRMMRQVTRGLVERLRGAQQDLARLSALVDAEVPSRRLGDLLPESFDLETEVTPISGLPTVSPEDQR